MEEPKCAKCGKVMTPKDSRIMPEAFYHDACLPDELRPKEQPRLVQVASQPWEGPQTVEEAKCLHDGFKAGATAYAAAVGHSTLKRDNAKLAELFDKSGWECIENFERLTEHPTDGLGNPLSGY